MAFRAVNTEQDVIRFNVRRGSFTIPRALRDLDPDEWARRFASSVPDDPDVMVSSVRDGDDDVFTWRVVTPYLTTY